MPKLAVPETCVRGWSTPRIQNQAPKKEARNRIMPRNYHSERSAIIRRWYGGNPQPRNPRPQRTWKEGPIMPTDCLGTPLPVNSPFRIPGHCMVWKYSLSHEGYGYLTIDGKRALTHRVVFIQTRGQIPEGMQVNHLCNRPYCVQPSPPLRRNQAGQQGRLPSLHERGTPSRTLDHGRVWRTKSQRSNAA